MKRRSLSDAFFRHKLLALVPIVVAIVAGSLFVVKHPRSYMATATMWADAPIPNPSTVNSSAGGTPPSQAQSAVLTELLATRTFLVEVARDTPMAHFVATAPRDEVDKALAGVASSVIVGTPGPQVISVSVKDNSRELSRDIAQSVVTNFISQNTDLLRQRAQALVEVDARQLEAAKAALADAQTQLLDYLGTHHGTSPITVDSAASQLTGAVALAQGDYADIQKQYAQDSAVLAHVGDTSVLNIIDHPGLGVAQSRKKVAIFAGGGALLAGITVSVLVLLLLMTVDNTARRESDVEEALGLRVIGSVEHLRTRRRHRRRTA